MPAAPNPAPDPTPADELLRDPLLKDAPTVEGFKVLDPVVLYAKVGKGGMGAVYRGRHFKLDLDVAVKCLNPSLAAEDPDFIKRFEREARLAASIGHQNVVRVMDVHEKNGLHYLVMEFVRGETAAERVKRKGPLAEKEALAILLGATAGLAEAHQRGIVHRDIKPDNVMISLEGRVKLADLGLAKSTGAVDGRSVSMPASRIMGTPQYMPPEQWDTTDVTAAADVWALGATFYFLLAGRAGISGAGTYHAVAKRIQEQDYPTLRAEREDVRPEVHELLERCVRREAKERYPDARALLKAVRKLTEEDDEVLLDPETGSGIARAGTVTPPPRQTVLRIRAAVEMQATGKPVALEPAAGVAPRGSTKVSPAASSPRAKRAPPTAAAPRSRAGLVGVLVMGLLLAVGGIGYAMGWFPAGQDAVAKTGEGDTGKQPSPGPAVPEPHKQPEVAADGKAAARAAFDRAMVALPRADGLDAAIADFEQALSLDASLTEAKAPLAGALGEKAQQLAASKPDEAFRLCKRAAELEPGDKRLASQAEVLRGQLAARLAQGLAIVEPKVDAVLGARQIVVSGRATSPNLKSVRVAVVPGGAVKIVFPEGRPLVRVIAGKFTTEITKDDVVADGRWLVLVQGEDQNGVVAMLEPVRVTVDTVDPVLTIESPAAGARVGSKVTVRGKAVDAGKCTVSINGQPAEVGANGEWSRELVLAEGTQDVVVEARDATGRAPVRATRSLQVDGTPPDLSVTPLPPFTNKNEVQIAGTVTGLGQGKLVVDGKPVVPGKDGAFAVPFRLTSDGDHSIAVLATDDVGNPKEVKVSVRRHTVAPVLGWTSPDVSKLVPAGEVEVAGTVTSDLAGTTVRVNGGVASVRSQSWTAKVRVEAGKELVVAVTATDVAGNEAKELRRTLKTGGVFGDRIGADFEVIASGGTGFGGLPKRIVHKATRIAFVLIPPGTFQMGSPIGEAGRGEDELRHKVTITQPYYLAETEVSIGQWRGFVQATGHKTDAETSGEGGYTAQYDKDGKWEIVKVKEAIWTNPLPYWKTKGTFEPDNNHPVTQVSWNDAMAFCKHYGLSLPTEAEWEYACRAGSGSRFWWGDREEDGLGKGNYADRGAEGRPLRWPDGFPFDDGFAFTAPVTRSVTANDFGLKDTIGNVWEWCADCANYDAPKVVTDTYRDGVTNPLCLSGSRRVSRGGCWVNEPANCRSANRFCDVPADAVYNLGFRPALSARSLSK